MVTRVTLHLEYRNVYGQLGIVGRAVLVAVTIPSVVQECQRCHQRTQIYALETPIVAEDAGSWRCLNCWERRFALQTEDAQKYSPSSRRNKR